MFAQTPIHAYTGRAAEQPVSGGGPFSYARAGQTAERFAGGGFAYTGRVAAEQPTFGGLQAGDYLSDLDTAEAQGSQDPLDVQIAQLERYERALLQQRQQERYWAEQRSKRERVEALRASCEALQQQAVPEQICTPGWRNTEDPSRDLGPGWAWRNARSEPAAQDGQPVASGLGSGALGAPTELHGVGTPRLGATLWGKHQATG